MSMDVTNKSNEAFNFTSALHTYFKVDDVEKIAIRSLKVRNYSYLEFQINFIFEYWNFWIWFETNFVLKTSINSLSPQNLEYLDKVKQQKEKEHRDEVVIRSETDSVYQSAPDHVTLIDGETKVSITKHNFTDYVVWNPYKEKAASIADMGPDDWKV